MDSGHDMGKCISQGFGQRKIIIIILYIFLGPPAQSRRHEN